MQIVFYAWEHGIQSRCGTAVKTAWRAETREKVRVSKAGVGKSESKKGRVTRDGIYERSLSVFEYIMSVSSEVAALANR